MISFFSKFRKPCIKSVTLFMTFAMIFPLFADLHVNALDKYMYLGLSSGKQLNYARGNFTTQFWATGNFDPNYHSTVRAVCVEPNMTTPPRNSNVKVSSMSKITRQGKLISAYLSIFDKVSVPGLSGATDLFRSSPFKDSSDIKEIAAVCVHVYVAKQFKNPWDYGMSASERRAWLNWMDRANSYADRVPDNYESAANVQIELYTMNISGFQNMVGGFIRKIERPTYTEVLIEKTFEGGEDPDAPYGYYEKEARISTNAGSNAVFRSSDSKLYRQLKPGNYHAEESLSSSSHYEPVGSTYQSGYAPPDGRLTLRFRNRPTIPPKGRVVVEKSALSNRYSNYSAYDLSGTRLMLTDKNRNTHTGRVRSSDGGRVEFDDIPIGEFTVTESDSASGYSVNRRSLSGRVRSGETTYLTGSDGFVNTPLLGSLTIYKKSKNGKITDNNKNYDLSGTEFRISHTEGGYDRTITTNSRGVASISDIPLGRYRITEIKAPKGFKLDNSSNTVNVTSGGSTTSFTAEDEPKVRDVPLELYKVDDERYKNETSYKPQGDMNLTDAKFHFKYFEDVSISESSAKTATPKFEFDFKLSNINGKAGTIFEESSISNFKSKDGTSLSSYLNREQFFMPIGSFTIEEVNPPSGYKLEDAAFDKTGKNFYLGHVSESDASSNSSVKVQLRMNEKKYFKGGIKVSKFDDQFKSYKPQGDAKLKATFDIYNKSKEPVYVGGKKVEVNSKVTTITTDDKTGIAQTEVNLPYGTYEVREVSTDNTYNLNPYTKSVQIRRDGEVVDLTSKSNAAMNTVKKGGISIKKFTKDFKANRPEGDATLEGAIFSIINKSTNPVFYDGREIAPGSEFMQVKTDKSGMLNTGKVLPVGKYQIKETKAPNGYLLNKMWVKDFAITVDSLSKNNGILDFTQIPSAIPTENKTDVAEAINDDVIRGDVKVYKSDIDRIDNSTADRDKPQGEAKLEKTELNIINRSQNPVLVENKEYAPGEVVKVITTDAKGIAKTEGRLLPYGSYEIKEKKAPEGYHLNSQYSATFKITEDGKTVDANGYSSNPLKETPIKGKVSIQKVDLERDTAVAQGDATLAGAEFSVYNDSAQEVYVNGKWVEPNDVALTIVTNKEGLAKSESVLPYGKYHIVETKPSNGYLLNSTYRKDFVIKEDNQSFEFNDKDKTPEQIIRGDVVMYKADVDKITSKDSSNYDKAQGNASLKGAVFNIINRSKAIVKVNGKDIAPGDVAATITTDDKGVAKTQNNLLPFGTYEIKEVSAPRGYLVNSTWSATFKIQKDKEVVKANEYTNNPAQETPMRGSLKLQKIDKEKNKAEPTGNATLGGAEFSIYNNSPLPVYVDNKWVKPGDVAKVITTDTTGLAKTGPKDLPFGTYYVKETKESEGYVLNKDYRYDFKIESDGQIVDITKTNPVPEQVVRADIHLTKHDYNRLLKDPKDLKSQGNASLKGAEFTIKNVSKRAVMIKGKLVEPGQIAMTLTTDEKGEFETNGLIFPYGTYEIRETKAPEGYHLNKDWKHVFTLNVYGVFDATTYKDSTGTHTMNDKVKRSPISLRKVDSETSENKPQGDATLAGATYTIYNESNLPVFTTHEGVDNGKFDVKAKIADILTKADGTMKYDTKEGGLPYGTYRIVETKASEGYLVNTNYEFKFGVTDEGNTTVISGKSDTDEQIIRGGVIITKHDKEFDKSEALGGKGHELSPEGTSLLGVKYEIVNKSKAAVMVDGKKYQPNEVVKTIFTEYDNNRHAYIAKTGQKDLPYGTYLVREVATHKSYELNKDTTFTFQIREDNKYVEQDINKKPLIFKNQVVRGDLTFRKLASDTKAPLTTAWIITNLTTGEEHVLLTDKNGNALTNGNKHSVNTNANDKFIKMARDKKVIDIVKDGGDFSAGIWFGKGEDGTMSKPVDSLGALPYGKYHADEIKSVSNTQYDLRDFDFYIHKNEEPESTTGSNKKEESTKPADKGDKSDSKETDSNKETASKEDTSSKNEPSKEDSDIVITSKGDIINQKIEIHTTAKDDVTLSHIGLVTKKAEIIDTVKYKNLRKGKNYRLDGILMDKETNSPFLIDGKPVKTSVKFTGEGNTGTVSIPFKFDSMTAKGHSLVVFEELFDLDYTEDLLIATHTDINDNGQTVNYPDITTFVKNDVHNHLGMREHVKSTKDQVIVSNLYNDSKFKYILDGVIMDKATGKPFTIKGKELRFTKTLDMKDLKNMTHDSVMNMPIDVSNLTKAEYDEIFSGKTLVMAQKLSVQEGNKAPIMIHYHGDMNDEDESIHFPQIKTKAYSPVSELQMLSIDGKVVDKVMYKNLIPNYKYKLTSQLFDLTENKVIDTVVTDFTPNTEDGELLVEEFNHSELPKSHKGHMFTIISQLDVANDDSAKVYSDVMSHNVLKKDETETVMLPEILTDAFYMDTQDKEGLGVKEMKVRDIVSYKNLDPTKEYTITTKLVDVNTKSYIGDDKGVYTFTKKFKPETKDGQVEVEMVVDGEMLQGHAFTIFESVELEGILVGNHEEVAEPKQTINVPKVGTKFFDLDTKLKEVKAFGKAKLRDVVDVSSLQYDTDYELHAVIMDKDTQMPISGADVVVNKFNTGKLPENLNPKEAHFLDKTVNMDFTVDMSKLEGKTLVAFEKLYRVNKDGSKTEVGRHEDFEDKDQTITVPKIRTTVTNDYLNENIGMISNGSMPFTDKVEFNNLVVGNTYKLEATIMDKDTNKPLKDANGEDIKAFKSFTAKTKDGFENVEFVLDTSKLEGKSIVVFEKLTQSDVEVGHHEDIEDKGQTVYFPKIRTTALFKDTKSHDGLAKKDTVVVDTVRYNNLQVGKEYTMSGVLMDKDTGLEFKIDGKPVTSSVTFTPNTSDGAVDIVFKFDGSQLAGKTLVAFEKLLRNDKELTVHTDINDEEQTVHFPKIGTSLVEEKTQYHEISADKKYTLVDRVKYFNLKPKAEYKMVATLMDKETDKPFVGSKTVELKFVPEKDHGYVDVKIPVDTTKLEGHTVVAFEKLIRVDVNKEVGRHEDKNDKEQTVTIPKIRTTAISDDLKDHSGSIRSDYKLTDTVKYENLMVGNTYTVEGIIMDKETNKPLKDAQGNEIKASNTFTAKKTDGTVDVTFEFTSEELKGKTIVVFEKLYNNKVELGHHEDINDENQSILFPTLKTTAYTKEDSKMVETSEKAVVHDRVFYTGLVVGKKYTVKGVLMDKETKLPVLKKSVLVNPDTARKSDEKSVKDYDNSDYVTSSKEFIPEKSDGYVDMTFEFDSTHVRGHSLVVFESLIRDNVEVITHTDIEDNDQTVHVPQIRTTLVDKESKLHETMASDETVLVDTVRYRGLIPGNTYTLKGILMDKETKKPFVDSDGNEVKSEAIFKAVKASGEAQIEFKFNSSASKNKTVVAFEYLYEKDNQIAVHTDIEDKEQSVNIPEISTSLVDTATSTKDVGHGDSHRFIDTVTYKNLIVGQDYKMKAVLMDKETNEPFLDKNGEKVVGETLFTPEETDGTVEVVFEFEGVTAGKTMVAFEQAVSLVKDESGEREVPVASHEDIEDAAQTVHGMKLGTTATADDRVSKIIDQKENVVIYDKLMYENVIAGTTYTAKAEVHDASTGDVLATETIEFTPEEADGFVEVPIKVDTTKYGGKKLVVTEQVFDENGILLGEHYDLNDEGQTVLVKEYTKVDSAVRKSTTLIGIGAAVALLAAGVMIYSSKKFNDNL